MTDKPASPSTPDSKRHWLWGGALSAAAALLTACGIRPQGSSSPGSPPPSVGSMPPAPSQAHTPKAYRQDAARHLYARNAPRIYQGPLPPLLYAVGTLQVHIDRHGQVRTLDWMRKPHHAPEVITEIERTVRAAAPFPVAKKLGAVVYTDTWLWHKSGKFQLDTLTEGQRNSSF